MKIYRAIGTILSAVLTLVLVILLTCSTLVLCAARAVSKDTVSDITKTVISNEDVQKEISAGLSAAITDMLFDFSIAQKPTQNGGTQSVEQSGKPSSSQTQEIPEQTLVVSEEQINEILNMPEVQNAISDIVSDYAMLIIEQKEDHNVSCAQTIENMLSENPDAFNAQFESILNDCGLSYDEVYDLASEFAAQNGFTIAPRGVSYTAIAISILNQKTEELDAMIESVIEEFLPATDSAEPSLSAASAIRTMPVLTAIPNNAEANNGEAQSALSLFSQILAILQNPRIYAALLSLLLVFFLITALFTWSFKRPLLFIGIAAILTGALLIGVSNLPIPYDMLAEIGADMIMPESASLQSTMHDVLVTAWDNASGIILTHASIAIAIGVISCTGFALLCIFGKKKKQTAVAA